MNKSIPSKCSGTGGTSGTVPHKITKFTDCKLYEVIQMSTTFTTYPEIPDIDPSSKNDTVQESNLEHKVVKWLKTQTKLLKRIIKFKKRQMAESVEMVNTENIVNTANTANTANTKKTSFLYKLGEAVIKAVPAVLTAVATAIVGFLFRRKTAPGNTLAGRTRTVQYE